MPPIHAAKIHPRLSAWLTNANFPANLRFTHVQQVAKVVMRQRRTLLLLRLESLGLMQILNCEDDSY